MERTIALIACILLGLVLGWAGERGPRPLPADAPADIFSAERAMGDVRIIAQAPHPTGSAANARVKAHLVARLQTLGLEPTVQVARPFAERVRGELTLASGARVENVVAVLPGQDRTLPALALMAHYDSVPGSPGAADDAAGVAAILEIARALQARGPPARDVVILFTDGEEIGLLGARAFFESHPLAERIGFVINLEARGSAGRATMFETGARNGPTVDMFARATTDSPSNALTVFAYRQMPNDTDFSVPRDQGLGGLNYAFTGRQFDYHSPTSTPETLSRRSLQDLGAQALATTSAAAYGATLPEEGPDRVYANTLAGKVVTYPPAVGWGIIGAAAALLALGVLRARRLQPPFKAMDAAFGALAGLYIFATAAVVLRFARRASGAGFGFLEQRELLAQAARFETVLLLLGLGVALLGAAACARGRMRLGPTLLAAGAGLGCQAFGGFDPVGLALGAVGAAIALLAFGRATYRSGAWAGLLATGLIVAVGVQSAAPTTAFLIAWPLLIASAGAALSALGERRPLSARILLILAGGVGLGWLAGYGHAIYVNLDMPELLAPIVWLSAFLLWPFAHPAIGGAGRITSGLLIGAGLALLVLVRLEPPWSERYPQATLVYYLLDQDQNRAFVIDAAPGPSAWTRRMLRGYGEIIEVGAEPVFSRPVRGAPAEVAQRPAPRIDVATGEDRVLITAAPAGATGDETLILEMRSDQPLADVRINGAPTQLLGEPRQWSRLSWRADDQPVGLSFRPASPSGQLEVRYAVVSPGWPAGARPLPSRPPQVMAFDSSDSTIVRGSRTLSW